MAGYCGYSKSNNAIEAEKEGRFPLTIAVKELAKKANITQKLARQILKDQGSWEWHHSSKFYNQVDYYDVEYALNVLSIKEYIEKFEANREEIKSILYKEGEVKGIINGEEVTQIRLIHQGEKAEKEVSEKFGIPCDLISDIYYSEYTWRECYDERYKLEKYRKF